MPHLVPLLIRGVNNLSDARYCAGMGADKITFILDPALPGHLDTKAVKELASWIAGVELIGEFDLLTAHDINAIAAECGLDAVLLRSLRTPEELAELAPPAYQELGWRNGELSLSRSTTTAGFIVELPETASGEMLEELTRIAATSPLWVGPGLSPARALELAQQLPLAGLSFPAGDEVKPGLRDFDQLEAVFEALEID